MRSGDEDEEFQSAVGEVKRLSNNTIPSRPAPKRPSAPDPASVDGHVEFGEELRYLRPGVAENALRKLRRGRIPSEATLDLHGLTAQAARNQLRNFLQQAQAAGRRAVRIIHGKGYGSTGRQPVLKAGVNHWLREADAVLAFCSARPENGGTGAVEVLLGKRRHKL